MNLELVLAMWVLDELHPEDVPVLATEALVQGCKSEAVAVLAGLHKPTGADVLDEIPALLQELGVALPGESEALKVYVDAVASDIVNGAVTPSTGAMQIRAVYYKAGDEYWEQFAEFYGCAVEYEELNRPTLELDSETRATARDFLASGGLQITPV